MVNYDIIVNTSIRRKVAELGFAVIPDALPTHFQILAKDLFERHARCILNNESGNTVAKGEQRVKRIILVELQQILQPWLNQHFLNFKMPLAAYYTKAGGCNNFGHLHRDPTIAPLPFASLSLWVALNPVDSNSGSLAFVPFSHRIFSGLQDKTTPLPYSGTLEYFEQFLEPVTLEAGQSVIFDNNILHTSTPHNGDLQRIAIGCKLMTEEAPLTTLYNNGRQTFQLQQPDDFYVHELWNDSFAFPDTTMAKEACNLSRRHLSSFEFLLKWWGLKIRHFL